jgi:hypothetical protein
MQVPLLVCGDSGLVLVRCSRGELTPSSWYSTTGMS